MTDNKLQSLTEIFNEKFFRIPDFQRGYSWGKNQLEYFWEDLVNLESESIHYTGLLTIETVKRESVEEKEQWEDDLWLFKRGFQAYYLIDGQQRLTTSIILINELLNKFNDDEGINFSKKEYWVQKFLFQTYELYKSYMFGYEKDNPSDEYFKTEILGQDSSMSDNVSKQTLYTANLEAAKEFFHNELSSHNKEGLERIFKKVVSNFKYNLYEIDNDLDVYVTFETMNNRGKPLSNLELLKNRLIYLSTLLKSDDQIKMRLRKDINETWKTIYAYLGKNKFKAMDDDDFLRNHWIMYFKYDRKESKSYAKYLLKEKFTAKKVLNDDLKVDEIKEYIDSLSKSAKPWFYLFNPGDSTLPYKDETKEWIEKLNRIGMGAFPPLFMASMIKSSEEEFLPLFKAAERFIFLVFRLSQRRSNTQNSRFYKLANSYYRDENPTVIKSAIEKVNRLTDGESEEEYYGWFDLNLFGEYIKEQYKKEGGFYSWNGLKYFLYEYELSLQDNANGNIKIRWSDFNKRKTDDTIEHIYPQTPTEKCWTSVFDSSYDDKQKKIMLHSIGNLLLLSQSKNSTLQNKCFKYKKKDTNNKGEEVGFFNGSYSEIKVASYDDWTPKEILERGIKMLEFMEERWNVDFKDWEIDKSAFIKNML